MMWPLFFQELPQRNCFFQSQNGVNLWCLPKRYWGWFFLLSRLCHFSIRTSTQTILDRFLCINWWIVGVVHGCQYCYIHWDNLALSQCGGKCYQTYQPKAKKLGILFPCLGVLMLDFQCLKIKTTALKKTYLAALNEVARAMFWELKAHKPHCN